MNKDWYSPYSALRSKDSIIWMLENFSELKSGGWWANPSKPIVQTKGDITEAYFVQASITLAELEIRLGMTGRDGDILTTVYFQQVPFYKLAYIMNLDEREVIRRADRALNYCVGKRRRKRSYQDFVTHPKYSKEDKYATGR